MSWDYVRPCPPDELVDAGLGFARAPDLERFARVEFCSRGGSFFDPEHGHLTTASIGFLWAASTHADKGSVKAGTAQLVKSAEPRKWGDAIRMEFLLRHFGPALPTFLITLSAPFCAEYDDRQFFALVDHELSHCAVAKDAFGAPRFSSQTGQPIWTIRPHDHEGFAGTIERWGAVAAGAESLVRAADKPPRFAWVPGADMDARKACGNS
jgi:hypothetical protein